MFPSNIIAGMFNFKEEEFFEVEDEKERAVPKVSFEKLVIRLVVFSFGLIVFSLS